MRTIKIQAGHLHITFSAQEHGLFLHSIFDDQTGYRFLKNEASFFHLKLRRPESEEYLELSSDSGWKSVRINQMEQTAVIAFSEHEEANGISVILIADIAQNRITWTTKLKSTNTDWSMYECDYPILSFHASAKTKVLFPYGCGEVYSSSKTFSTKQNYPSYGASMQFMAVWNEPSGKGLYYGLHDPAPAYKKFFFQKEDGCENACIKAIMPLRDIDRSCNSQVLEGTLVWELFDGDWYDATKIYQEFFERFASWKPIMHNGKRDDTPEWLRANPHWWRKRMLSDTSFADELLEADSDMGLSSPSPVHLYDWHQIPYDTNYPHYFPAKEAFQPGIQKLQNHGIRVMPYINGRLWDTHDRGKEDWQFTKLARPFCTKKVGDQPFLEVYPTSKIDLAIMCPSTALWQEKQQELVNNLLNKEGVDGVYIDQIGAAQAYPCEDKTHNHRAGGGTWWVESYRNLLDHIRRVMPPTGFITTECTSEPYMKNIQGYLSWIWIKNHQVPSFMVLYSRYVVVFGRSYDAAPDAQSQNIFAAQSLTFGEQMGWIKPEVYKKLKHKDFYKKCVHCREQFGSYIYDGKLLRSPVIQDKTILRTRKIPMEAYDGLLEHTATFSEIWERDDGKRIMFLINASSKDTDSILKSNNLPDGTYSAIGDITQPIQIKNGELEVLLPALSVSVLEF